MTTAPATGTCRMCFQTEHLEYGHVVPSFVSRWLKDTSALGFLRTGENPNLRVQDGWKRHWFCRRCEDTMGRFEKAFSERLFPLVVGEQPAPYSYGPWLSRFIASVAWRTVMWHMEHGDTFQYFTPRQKSLVPVALEWWRAFVRGEITTPGDHELHFLPMGRLAEYSGDRTLPPNINWYTLRSVEIHVAGRVSEAFAFIKMGPAVALGFIQPPPQGTWEGTRVGPDEGQVGGRTTLPVQFLDYYIDRARRTSELQQRRSARQTEKIHREFEENLDRAVASDTFRALEADVDFFGEDQVFPPDPEASGR